MVDPGGSPRLRGARALPRLVLAAPARRLPRDRDAVLRPGVRRLHERRRPVRDHERLERPRQRRTARRSSAATSRSARPGATTGSCSAASLVVLVVLYCISESRTGRAWKASREDPLAAEMMGMPVNRLKIMAFSFGAAIAGLAGSVFAAAQTGAFPQNFGTQVLILIYAVVILGRHREPDRDARRRDRDHRVEPGARLHLAAERRPGALLRGADRGGLLHDAPLVGEDADRLRGDGRLRPRRARDRGRRLVARHGRPGHLRRLPHRRRSATGCCCRPTPGASPCTATC